MGSILRPTKIAKKLQIFFINLCDAITDVIFFMCIDAILGCDTFEKKTFDSKRLPSLLKSSIPAIVFKTSAFLGSTRTEYPSLREKAMDISVQIFRNIIIYAKNIFI